MLHFATHPHLPLAAAIAVATVLSAPAASAAPIELIDINSVVGNTIAGIDDLITGTPLQITVNDLFRTEGLTFGERFAGQALGTVPVTSPLFPGSTTSDHDTLSGTPTSMLTLLSGNPSENISITRALSSGGGGNYRISGNAPIQNGLTLRGEGALSLLFDDDQSQLGFSVTGAGGISNRQPVPSGPVTAQFFRRDGSLIDSLELALGSVSSISHFGFLREGGLVDIAGVSLTNIDAFGVSYDDFIYSYTAIETAVPEPSSLLVMTAALLGFSSIARRRSATSRRK